MEASFLLDTSEWLLHVMFACFARFLSNWYKRDHKFIVQWEFLFCSSPSLQLRRNLKKHVRFQDQNFCDSIHDYSLGKIVRDAKIRRVEGKPFDPFHDFHVGGTTLCADYAKRSLLEAAAITSKCDQKTCNYSNNYPAPTTKRLSRFSSIFV